MFCDSESITLPTQKHVERFGGLQCTRVNWLRIGGISGSYSAISSLKSLSSIKQVENLIISYNADLADVTGFNNVTKVSGELWISHNPKIASLAAFENIKFIGGSVLIQDNGALTNLLGCQSIIKIGGSLQILHNRFLIALTGLEGLTKISGSVEMWNNLFLSSITALSNVIEIGGSLRISKNGKLTSLVGLTSLTDVGGDLQIIGDPRLLVVLNLSEAGHPGVNGLYSTAAVYPQSESSEHIVFEKEYPHPLGWVIGYFSKLSSLGPAWYIFQESVINGVAYWARDQEGIESMDDLSARIPFSGWAIWGGAFSSPEQKRPAPKFEYSAFNYYDEAFLNHFSLLGLHGLQRIKGNMEIIGTPVRNLSGLENIRELGGHLRIEKNWQLSSLHALSNLREASGVMIRRNPRLRSLEGLKKALNVKSRAQGGDRWISSGVNVQDNHRGLEVCNAGSWGILGMSPCKLCHAGTMSSSGASTCSNCAVHAVSRQNSSRCWDCSFGTVPSLDRSACRSWFVSHNAVLPYVILALLLSTLAFRRVLRPCLRAACARRLKRQLVALQRADASMPLGGAQHAIGSAHGPLGDMQVELITFPTNAAMDDKKSDKGLSTMLLEYANIFKSAQLFGATEVADEILSATTCTKDPTKLRAVEKMADEFKWSELGERASVQLERARQESAMLGMQLDFMLTSFEPEVTLKLRNVEWRTHTDGMQYTYGTFFQWFHKSAEWPAQWAHAQKAVPPCNPNFVQLAPVVAYGEQSSGYNKVCPRDGLMHCSITDAVQEHSKSGRANQFLSWVWTYPVSTAIGALRRWSDMEAQVNRHFDAKSTYVWWCFFCNNQFRLLKDQQPQSTETLAKIFGNRLKEVGRVLVLMDGYKESKYVTRIWCIFEMYIACDFEIPCTIIVPATAVNASRGKMQSVSNLIEACDVDTEQAKASVPEDEEGIKNLIIAEHGSFDLVNRVVNRALLVCIVEAMRTSELYVSNLHSS